MARLSSRIVQVVGGSSVRRVPYTASGDEGTDFFVPIGTTLEDDDYDVVLSPRSVASFPVFDLPNEVDNDRSTDQFRVRLAAPLTAGDKLVFLIFE